MLPPWILNMKPRTLASPSQYLVNYYALLTCSVFNDWKYNSPPDFKIKAVFISVVTSCSNLTTELELTFIDKVVVVKSCSFTSEPAEASICTFFPSKLSVVLMLEELCAFKYSKRGMVRFALIELMEVPGFYRIISTLSSTIVSMGSKRLLSAFRLTLFSPFDNLTWMPLPTLKLVKGGTWGYCSLISPLPWTLFFLGKSNEKCPIRTKLKIEIAIVLTILFLKNCR